MPQQTWTLVDVERGIFQDDVSLTPADLPGAPDGWSITKRTLRGGKQAGVEIVEIDNGAFRTAIVPTRGMGLWRCSRGERTLGWRSPVRGPVHPQFVPLMEPGGLGWLEGFDELLVRCGLESNGAPDFDAEGRLRYPLHGRIANLPAHKLEVSVDRETGEITLTGVVEESRFHFHKLRLTATYTWRLGENHVSLRDEVTNFGGTPAEMQLLYHINVGQPLLEPGAELVAPVEVRMPRDADSAVDNAGWATYGPEQPGQPERAFFMALRGDAEGRTQVLLKNPSGREAFGLQINKRQLPYFVQWKNPAAAADGYVTGLEPALNLPNARSFEGKQGRVARLAAGETRRFDLRLDWHDSAETIAAAEAQIAALAAGGEAKIHTEPQSGWCPSATDPNEPAGRI